MAKIILCITLFLIILSWILIPNSLVNFFTLILIGGLGICVVLKFCRE